MFLFCCHCFNLNLPGDLMCSTSITVSLDKAQALHMTRLGVTQPFADFSVTPPHTHTHFPALPVPSPLSNQSRLLLSAWKHPAAGCSAWRTPMKSAGSIKMSPLPGTPSLVPWCRPVTTPYSTRASTPPLHTHVLTVLSLIQVQFLPALLTADINERPWDYLVSVPPAGM